MISTLDEVCLERKANCQDRIVICSVETGGRDLVSASKGQTYSTDEMESPQKQAWGYEILFPAIVLPFLEER